MRSAFVELLSARKLTRPDGRHLSAYRVTAVELEAIRHALEVALEPRDPEWGVLFCIFSAEQIRRTYDGGPWKWEPIFDAIGRESPNLQALYGRIEQALRYLGRPLLRTTAGDRQFLVTLMCEGGVPLRVLRNESARLTRFLRLLLADIERYPTIPVHETARRAANEHLPVSLRNDVFLEFSVRLVEAIRDLRARVKVRSNAVAELDGIDFNWRAQVPIALDDQSAQALLEGLLTVPREPAEKSVNIVLDTFLESNGGGSRLVRRIEPCDDLTEQVLASRVENGHVGQLPSRIGIQIIVGDGERVAAGAIVRKSGGGFIVRPSSQPAVIENANRPTPIVLTQGSRYLATISVPGSEALGEGPWVFLPIDEGHGRLRAVGSCRIRSSHLLVALPARPISEQEGEIAEVGTIHGRRLVQMSGTLRWNEDAGTTVVSSNADLDTRRFGLRGALRPFLFLDREVFVGTPDVVELNEDGAERIVPRESVDLRPSGSQVPWLRATGFRGSGETRLRFVDNSETVFTTNMTIVPSDFRIELDLKDGCVRVRCKSLRSMDAPADRPHVKAPREGDLHQISFIGAETFPGPVELSFRFDQGDFCARVPFPARCLAFTDREGKAIAPGTPLSAQALSGLHARYIAPAAAMRDTIDIEASVGRGPPEYVGQLTDCGSGIKELHLEVIRERLELLLASGGDSDDELSLTLGARGGEYGGRRARINLRRYDSFLDPERRNDHAILVLRKMKNAFGDFESIRIQAVPLWQPTTGAVDQLESIGDGRWIFRYSTRRSGPWLVTGWIGNNMCMRPLLITVPGTASERTRPRVERAVRTFNVGERRAMFDQLCGELSSIWNQEEWSGMDEFLDTLGVFPAFTFDAVRHITSHPGTAILALLRSQSANELQQRWRHFEDLPFSWSLLPLGNWMLAGKALREEASRRAEACKSEGIEGDWSVRRFVRDLVAPLVDAQLPPFIGCIREIWPTLLADFADVPDGLLTRTSSHDQLAMVTKGLVESFTNDLLNRHAEDTLPQAHLEDLGSEARDLGERLAAGWWSTAGVGYRRDVLHTPVLAAAIMVTGTRASEETIRAVRRLRSFDEDWFDQVHAFALAVLVSEKRAEHPTFLDELAGL